VFLRVFLPDTPVLSQLKQFLPKMQAANEELQQKLQVRHYKQ
jgi:hypothetical protein